MAERILRVDPAKHDGIERVTFDNTQQVRRILYRLSSYGRSVWRRCAAV